MRSHAVPRAQSGCWKGGVEGWLLRLGGYDPDTTTWLCQAVREMVLEMRRERQFTRPAPRSTCHIPVRNACTNVFASCTGSIARVTTQRSSQCTHAKVKQGISIQCWNKIKAKKRGGGGFTRRDNSSWWLEKGPSTSSRTIPSALPIRERHLFRLYVKCSPSGPFRSLKLLLADFHESARLQRRGLH